MIGQVSYFLACSRNRGLRIGEASSWNVRSRTCPENSPRVSIHAELIFRLLVHKQKGLRNSIVLLRTRCAWTVRVISSKRGWVLSGEGKWLKPASGRCSPLAVTGREKGLAEIGISGILSTMEHGKVEIGWRSCSAPVGNLGRVLNGC
jgi:hypothetical protein